MVTDTTNHQISKPFTSEKNLLVFSLKALKHECKRYLIWIFGIMVFVNFIMHIKVPSNWVDQKCLSYIFHIRKLCEKTFSINPKKNDLKKKISEFLGCAPKQTQVAKTLVTQK